MTPQDIQLLARRLDRLMRRLNAALHPRAQAMDKEKVGALGGMVLMELADRGPLPLAVLSAEMGRDKSQMTRLVQMLEGKGHVARSADAKDRRVSLIALTPRGEAFVRDVEMILGEVLEEILSPLGEAERRAFLANLGKL
ncbi:MAG: MarR family transcriptional regulator [Pseudomonadota bacterium]